MRYFHTNWMVSVFLACSVAGTPGTIFAAEGASSNYFPGAYGILLPGVAPEPGAVVANISLFYSADVSTAVLQGATNIGIEADAYYNLNQILYVWDAPAIGGRFAVGRVSSTRLFLS